jgi:hypothetical protein
MKPQVLDTQLGLFTAHPMARLTDHDSSHAAADRMQESGCARAQRDLVLALVRRYPGSTSLQLAELGRIDRYIPGRRLSELKKEGRVEAVKPEGKEIQWFPT